MVSVFLALADTIYTSLPTLPQDITLVLHLTALVGVAYGFDVEIISFKGNRVRVFGRYATNPRAVLALLTVFIILAMYDYWVELIYPLLIFSGWQAFGLILVTAAWTILSKSHRNIDIWIGSLLFGGLFLILTPWMT